MEYKAGQTITLKPGFVARSGSYFRASIEACAGQFGKAPFTTQNGQSRSLGGNNKQ